MSATKMIGGALALALAAAATPAAAGWKVVSANAPTEVAKSRMKATPAVSWNRQTKRPSPKAETWTLDGAALNEVSFFGGVGEGETIYKELDRKGKPLPRFKANMLPTDVVALFEASQRIMTESSLFAVDKVEPATLGGHKGVRFEYHYSLSGDQLNRRGEAVAAIVGGKLYLVSFAAPDIHYFDRDVAQFRAIVRSVAI